MWFEFLLLLWTNFSLILFFDVIVIFIWMGFYFFQQRECERSPQGTGRYSKWDAFWKTINFNKLWVLNFWSISNAYFSLTSFFIVRNENNNKFNFLNKSDEKKKEKKDRTMIFNTIYAFQCVGKDSAKDALSICFYLWCVGAKCA